MPNDSTHHAEQNHWSECGRATSVAITGALGRPHRSVLSLGDIMHSTIIITLVVVVTLIGLEACGLYLVIRDTRRRSGKWGINRKPVSCPRCHSRAPFIRIPTSWRQAMWGGWTCKSCGCEMDKWGAETP